MFRGLFRKKKSFTLTKMVPTEREADKVPPFLDMLVRNILARPSLETLFEEDPDPATYTRIWGALESGRGINLNDCDVNSQFRAFINFLKQLIPPLMVPKSRGLDRLRSLVNPNVTDQDLPTAHRTTILRNYVKAPSFPAAHLDTSRTVFRFLDSIVRRKRRVRRERGLGTVDFLGRLLAPTVFGSKRVGQPSTANRKNRRRRAATPTPSMTKQDMKLECWRSVTRVCILHWKTIFGDNDAEQSDDEILRDGLNEANRVLDSLHARDNRSTSTTEEHPVASPEAIAAAEERERDRDVGGWDPEMDGEVEDDPDVDDIISASEAEVQVAANTNANDNDNDLPPDEGLTSELAKRVGVIDLTDSTIRSKSFVGGTSLDLSDLSSGDIGDDDAEELDLDLDAGVDPRISALSFGGRLGDVDDDDDDDVFDILTPRTPRGPDDADEEEEEGEEERQEQREQREQDLAKSVEMEEYAKLVAVGTRGGTEGVRHWNDIREAIQEAQAIKEGRTLSDNEEEGEVEDDSTASSRPQEPQREPSDGTRGRGRGRGRGGTIIVRRKKRRRIRRGKEKKDDPLRLQILAKLNARESVQDRKRLIDEAKRARSESPAENGVLAPIPTVSPRLDSSVDTTIDLDTSIIDPEEEEEEEEEEEVEQDHPGLITADPSLVSLPPAPSSPAEAAATSRRRRRRQQQQQQEGAEMGGPTEPRRDRVRTEPERTGLRRQRQKKVTVEERTRMVRRNVGNSKRTAWVADESNPIPTPDDSSAVSIVQRQPKRNRNTKPGPEPANPAFGAPDPAAAPSSSRLGPIQHPRRPQRPEPEPEAIVPVAAPQNTMESLSMSSFHPLDDLSDEGTGRQAFDDSAVLVDVMTPQQDRRVSHHRRQIRRPPIVVEPPSLPSSPQDDILSDARTVLEAELMSKTLRSEFADQMKTLRSEFGEDLRQSQEFSRQTSEALRSRQAQHRETVASLQSRIGEVSDGFGRALQQISDLTQKNAELEAVNVDLQRRIGEMEAKFDDIADSDRTRDEDVRRRLVQQESLVKDLVTELTELKLRMSYEESFRSGGGSAASRRRRYQPLTIDRNRTDRRERRGGGGGYVPGQYRYVPLTRKAGASSSAQPGSSPVASRVSSDTRRKYGFESDRRRPSTLSSRTSATASRRPSESTHGASSSRLLPRRRPSDSLLGERGGAVRGREPVASRRPSADHSRAPPNRARDFMDYSTRRLGKLRSEIDTFMKSKLDLV